MYSLQDKKVSKWGKGGNLLLLFKGLKVFNHRLRLEEGAGAAWAGKILRHLRNPLNQLIHLIDDINFP